MDAALIRVYPGRDLDTARFALRDDALLRLYLLLKLHSVKVVVSELQHDAVPPSHQSLAVAPVVVLNLVSIRLLLPLGRSALGVVVVVVVVVLGVVVQ